eukprot:1616925-Pleurochrysis_carterae.AAC.1
MTPLAQPRRHLSTPVSAEFSHKQPWSWHLPSCASQGSACGARVPSAGRVGSAGGRVGSFPAADWVATFASALSTTHANTRTRTRAHERLS